MKKLLLSIAIFASISAIAQQKGSIESTVGRNPIVTDTILIKIDTTTYKAVLSLIQENISSQTLTGRIVVGNIIKPLQNFTFLQPADKPKETAVKGKQ